MRILVTRFSALGDVTLCYPVLQQFRAQFPRHEIYFLSRPPLRDVFAPLNINFTGVDLKQEYRGIQGIFKLSQYILKNIQPDVVIDLHNVLRTQILRKFLAMKGVKCVAIDKGRAEKKQLIRLKNKKRIPLKHTTERYAEAFIKAGFNFEYKIQDFTSTDFQGEIPADKLLNRKPNQKIIGIAPFAKHKGKSWPISKVMELLQLLETDDYKILLFGGKENLEEMQHFKSFKNVKSVAGLYNFTTELELIGKIDLLLSMDSFNMHLAALTDTPVISIWGATHTFAGFGPIGKNAGNTLEVPIQDLGCRPCSIYGNRPCYRGDYACLNWIEAKEVKEKIDSLLHNSHKP